MCPASAALQDCRCQETIRSRATVLAARAKTFRAWPAARAEPQTQRWPVHLGGLPAASPSVASELRKPPCGSAGMGGDCVDGHDGGSTPKVSGREPGNIGGGHGRSAPAELLAGGGNNGRFGGSHAIAPMRLAGISDQIGREGISAAAAGAGGARVARRTELGPRPASRIAAARTNHPDRRRLARARTNHRSRPGAARPGAAWAGRRCAAARGSRAHCAGSVGSNGSSGSNGIGSPACAGGEKEKAPATRSLICLVDRGVDSRRAAARRVGQQTKNLTYVFDGTSGGHASMLATRNPPMCAGDGMVGYAPISARP